MLRSMATTIFLQGAVLFLAATVIGVVSERMSARQAESCAMAFAGIDLLITLWSVWLYRRLAKRRGGHEVSWWSTVVFAALAILIGIMMLFATMLILNR